jgi:hypothetical protein
LEDLGIGGRIILTWFLRNRVEGSGLDSFGSGRDWWQALLNTVTNLQIL